MTDTATQDEARNRLARLLNQGLLDHTPADLIDAILANPALVMAALGATPAVRLGGLTPAWYPQNDDDTDEPDGWIVPIP